MRVVFSLLSVLVVFVACGSEGGAAGGGNPLCPQPRPMPCDMIEKCPCPDGTTQIGGCNGLTCKDACCGHGI